MLRVIAGTFIVLFVSAAPVTAQECEARDVGRIRIFVVKNAPQKIREEEQRAIRAIEAGRFGQAHEAFGQLIEARRRGELSETYRPAILYNYFATRTAFLVTVLDYVSTETGSKKLGAEETSRWARARLDTLVRETRQTVEFKRRTGAMSTVWCTFEASLDKVESAIADIERRGTSTDTMFAAELQEKPSNPDPLPSKEILDAVEGEVKP